MIKMEKIDLIASVIKDCSTSTRLWRLAIGKTILTKIEQYELKLGEIRKFIIKVQKKA